MSKLYNTKFKPTKAGLVQAAVDYVIKKIPKKKKVSPDIKSVKPDLKKTVKETKTDEYLKRIKEVEGAEKKIKIGKKMIKEGQEARKKMIDTKRAFQFKHSKSTHAIKPGDKPEVKYKGNVREQKMGGGMMGRRMGYSQGSNGKPVSRSKNPGLLKMSKSEKGKTVVKKFGYNPNRIVAKKGGKA